MEDKGQSMRMKIRGFLARHMLPLLSVFTIATVVMAFVYLSHASKQIMQENAVTGAQRYLEALAEFRTLYTSEVIKTAKRQGLTISHNYQDIEGAIPLPATLSMALGKKIGAHQSGAKTYLYSRYPFPWRRNENQALFRQGFTQAAWQALTANPQQAYYRFEDFDGRPSIRYAIADQMRPACVNCHNQHQDSPKNNWQVGDVRGVMEVILPIDVAQLETQSTLTATFTVLGLLTMLLSLILGIVFSRLKKDTQKLTDANYALGLQNNQVEEKNIEISVANQRLEKYTDELLQANQAKSDFLACMSHEIRTPINGVMGMLGLMLKHPLSDAQHHKATLAQSSAQSLLTLINDILDFSKVDAGKLELEELDFNLRAMVSELAQTMALRIQEKGLELVLDINSLSHEMVKGDPGRLRQIITNLVGNAIKFTQSGEIVIRGHVQQTDEQELVFHCSVADTGMGIPHDKQASLFEAFTQVDASTTRKYGGTGLGLSIVHKLCELMGGEIKVTSDVGKGSIFEFNVMLKPCEQVSLPIPQVNMEKLRLLIVDDNDTNREVLRGQLEMWGAQVVEAADAQSAMEILYEHTLQENKCPFHMAIIDMQMPIMDGAQLATKITRDDRFDTMRLVMMTSLAHRGDAQYFADLGFSAYFAKPATPADLSAALAIIMEDGVALHQASPLLTHHYLASLQHDDQVPSSDSSGWPKDVRLLLVEDNQINQEVALGMLEIVGLSADIAANGVEALQSLKSAPQDHPYTLVIMDCQMPEMNGYQAAAEIRDGQCGERYLHIPIIAMTANTMQGDKEKCLQAGMDDFVGKPVNNAELSAKLTKWLLNKN